MNKEFLVAILIGTVLGIGVAIYFSNINTKPQTNLTTTNTIEITPKLTSQIISLAVFSNLPDNDSILNSQTLKLSGKANNKTLLLAINQNGIKNILVKNNKFNDDFSLKPGLNDLILFEKNQTNDQTKVLKLYYFVPRDTENNSSSSAKEEATGEAQILKNKLEKKVLELREKPKRVVSGEVTAISEKQISIKDNNNVEKIALEPEITNFYEVKDLKLVEIGADTIVKGNNATVYVSEIGGDEKAYTVYLEPDKKVVIGKISNLDEDNYNVTLVNFDKASLGADVETDTTQQVLDMKTKKITEYGFSKLSIGQQILAILNTSKPDYFFDTYLIIK